MNTCRFCNRQYHPMPVYINGTHRIHVCGAAECVDKARRLGYQFSRKHTPTR